MLNENPCDLLWIIHALRREHIFCIRFLYVEKWELDNISDDYSISPVDMQLGWDDASILIRIRVTNAGD